MVEAEVASTHRVQYSSAYLEKGLETGDSTSPASGETPSQFGRWDAWHCRDLRSRRFFGSNLSAKPLSKVESCKAGARDRLAAVRRCEVELFLSEATGS